MATYSNNTTVKANASIAAASGGFANGNLYTAPANGYAIINIGVGVGSGNGSMGVTVGGQYVAERSNNGTSGGTSIAGGAIPAANMQYGGTGAHVQSLTGVYVGPGQTVAAVGTGGLVYAWISGTEFVNTP